MVSYIACKINPKLLLLLQVLFGHLLLISDHSVVSLTHTHTHTQYLCPFGCPENSLLNEGLDMLILY